MEELIVITLKRISISEMEVCMTCSNLPVADFQHVLKTLSEKMEESFDHLCDKNFIRAGSESKKIFKRQMAITRIKFKPEPVPR